MERREIEIFLTLAEELHFGRTAARLYVSQARVSQTVAALERRFGVPLFERTSRRVRLTPVGEALRAEVRAGHDRIRAGIDAAVAAGRELDGVLTVGLEAPGVADLAAPVLERYRRRRPRTEVRLREADFADPLAVLRSGEVDVLVTDGAVTEPGLVAGPVVVEEPVVLAVPVGHRLAGRDRVTPDDLGGEVVLRAGRRGPPYWRPPRAEWTTADGTPVYRGPAAATFQDLLGAVARGGGICPVAGHAADYFARPTLAFVPFDEAAGPVRWRLAWRAGPLPERVRDLAAAAGG